MKTKNVSICLELIKAQGLTIDQGSLDNLKKTNVSVDTFANVLGDLVSQRGQLEFWTDKIQIGIYFKDVCMISLSQSGTANGISRQLAQLLRTPIINI